MAGRAAARARAWAQKNTCRMSKCGRCDALCPNLKAVPPDSALSCCLCRKEASPCPSCKPGANPSNEPAVLVAQEDEWETKGSHSEAFRAAVLVTTEEEWETGGSHSEAFRGAALVAEEEEWETTGSHSEAFVKSAAVADEDENPKPK